MAEQVLQLVTAAEQPQAEPALRFQGQLNLFTSELEPLPIEVPEPREYGEIRVDDGISLVKTEDSSQLVLSGFGLFLRKKSERLLVKKGDNLIYQFPSRAYSVEGRTPEHRPREAQREA